MRGRGGVIIQHLKICEDRTYKMKSKDFLFTGGKRYFIFRLKITFVKTNNTNKKTVSQKSDARENYGGRAGLTHYEW